MSDLQNRLHVMEINHQNLYDRVEVYYEELRSLFWRGFMTVIAIGTVVQAILHFL